MLIFEIIPPPGINPWDRKAGIVSREKGFFFFPKRVLGTGQTPQSPQGCTGWDFWVPGAGLDDPKGSLPAQDIP